MGKEGALQGKLRRLRGDAARERLLQRFSDLGGGASEISWLSLDETDAVTERWASQLSNSPEMPLTIKAPSSGALHQKCVVGEYSELDMPNLSPTLLVLFGDYKSMGIARVRRQFLATSLEALALADGNGFVAGPEELSFVLQVRLYETLRSARMTPSGPSRTAEAAYAILHRHLDMIMECREPVTN